jgi:hypothetical protein
MSMNLRHAAALALVSWYLMVPPWTAGHDGRPIQPLVADSYAPLSKWATEGSFDSAADCGLTLYRLRCCAGDPLPDRKRADKGSGIKSDDPRLKDSRMKSRDAKVIEVKTQYDS